MTDVVSIVNDHVFGVWFLIGAALVFFMQAGFAMVEAGFTRAKNTGNILMKNLMDFCIGCVAFILIGFSFLLGEDLIGLIGKPGFDIFTAYAGFDFSNFVFNLVFCATTATIVSGAMAERTKFLSYCVYSAVISALIYPIEAHWIWGGGWLAQMGFHDFAGSTAVHMVGGVAALVGAAFLGPRIGKFDKNGKARAIPGHSLTLGALGVFILWFCWFGFNGASTVAMTDGAYETASSVYVTTNLAAAVATVTVMCVTWIRYGKPDVSMTLNGSLAGLVAITAGCDLVTPFGAAIIGICAGFAVIFGIEFVEKVLKIDDPVGAFGVHGVNGALGTLLTGLLAKEDGLFYGGGAHFFLVQVIGVAAVIAWVAVTMTIVFWVIKHTIGLRVSEEEEVRGLDVMEHGLSSAYADFMPIPTVNGFYKNEEETTAVTVPMEEAVPATEVPSTTADGHKLTKVVVICRQSRLEVLRLALEEIGVAGLTVTNVLGCGVEKGATEYYRGVQMNATLHPKTKVEMVISRVPVETVVDTCRKVLYTGHIGDGKIFIYDVQNVIKIRTGAEGYDALQYEK